MHWLRLLAAITYPLAVHPVWLSLRHMTTIALLTAHESVAAHAWDPRREARLPRIDDGLRSLDWGQLQILHTTDVHGWYQGHTKLSPPEPNYSGDWGDWVAFTQHMRKRAAERGVDLLLVDTGDLHDGNGLSDGFPELSPDDPQYKLAVDGHASNQIFAFADYDLLTIGNHELYNFSVAADVYEYFVPLWKGRYLTSNVNITLQDTPDTPPRSRPIGDLYARFVTQHGVQIQAYGVLFDFRLAAEEITIQSPEHMVQQAWFLESLRKHDRVDVFVVAGHMPVADHAGWKAVHAAIRAVWPDTPIMMLAGHTHLRDCQMLDQASMALESGRYMETIGWMSIEDVTARPPTFSRRYIDANPRNFAFHAGLAHANQLSTRRGKFVRAAMDKIVSSWNLTHLFGLAPQDYFLDRYAYPSNTSLLTLMQDHILPEIVRPVNPRHADTPTLLLINSGSQRFDVLAGPFTKNDQYVVSPFRDNFLYVEKVPWRLAQNLVHGLNRRGALVNGLHNAQHAAQGDADSIFRRYLKAQWQAFWSKRTSIPSDAAAPSGRPAQERKLQALLQDDAAQTLFDPNASLGYVTVDGCAGIGDDTQHIPVPYSAEQPDYLASNPSPLPEADADVDVVFVDFILAPLLDLLNQGDDTRVYTKEDAASWGNISTSWLYPLYAQHAWSSADMDAQMRAMERSALLAGYPPMPNGAGDPYTAVVQARAQAAPLVFQ
ncbi:hypothetical protein MVES1_001224 [Malassezia vespertilionis]|uniref:Uncharacterized protein n=1 Tax=Malassezia vespertilionis TaxID=2020962 RepID=A0A2N1JDV4_9BASI|nr:uncharacterized protein MVES1_001224 [Malassezia vespertilionis]PKI84737.1 hypothetical protein MVES_001154 [Malassezia vespertilionis]WFD05890.1 hypothetical protein MVES1_001224 [Malassezia vespertilionis]